MSTLLGIIFGLAWVASEVAPALWWRSERAKCLGRALNVSDVVVALMLCWSGPIGGLVGLAFAIEQSHNNGGMKWLGKPLRRRP